MAIWLSFLLSFATSFLSFLVSAAIAGSSRQDQQQVYREKSRGKWSMVNRHSSLPYNHLPPYNHSRQLEWQGQGGLLSGRKRHHALHKVCNKPSTMPEDHTDFIPVKTMMIDVCDNQKQVLPKEASYPPIHMPDLAYMLSCTRHVLCHAFLYAFKVAKGSRSDVSPTWPKSVDLLMWVHILKDGLLMFIHMFDDGTLVSSSYSYKCKSELCRLTLNRYNLQPKLDTNRGNGHFFCRSGHTALYLWPCMNERNFGCVQNCPFKFRQDMIGLPLYIQISWCMYREQFVSQERKEWDHVLSRSSWQIGAGSLSDCIVPNAAYSSRRHATLTVILLLQSCPKTVSHHAAWYTMRGMQRLPDLLETAI